jgi:hypothetical protein
MDFPLWYLKEIDITMIKFRKYIAPIEKNSPAKETVDSPNFEKIKRPMTNVNKSNVQDN